MKISQINTFLAASKLPNIVAKYVRADDETMDDAIAFLSFGVPSSIGIQICEGGYFHVLQYTYKNGELNGLIVKGEFRSLTAAMTCAITHLKDDKVSS